MTAQELTIEIPTAMWQTSNQRLHRMEEARRTKHVRTLAGWSARKLEPVTSQVHVHAYVSAPKKSRADVGNTYPTVKAVIDGCTDAGVWPDDNDDHLIGPDMRRAEPTRVPGMYRVRIVITPVAPT